MVNILEKLVNNSKKAIQDGIYDINESLPNSGTDLENIITESVHATSEAFKQVLIIKSIACIFWTLKFWSIFIINKIGETHVWKT